ncbi:MAG: extracellular solute-binding protein [Planctomycetes bacterium]|nr:extracellular solute-binding protein [Planctomycetota bacterium]
MLHRMVPAVGRTFQWLLAACAVLLIAWAFLTVGIRELGRLLSTDARTEIVVMHWSGEGGQEEDAIVEAALARFTADNPGIRVRRINPGDAGSFYTKLQTMMASGDPPDVFYVGSERVPSFVDLGLLLPVDDFLAADVEQKVSDRLDLDGFYPATVAAFRFDGERSGQGSLYGIPKDFTTVGFYWNKDLFAKAGVSPPRDDWTWDEFIAAARRIGTLPDCTGAEFVTWPAMVRAYLMTDGLDIKGTSFEMLRTGEPAVFESLDRLRGWRHDERGALTSGKSKIASGSSVFLSGKVGMAGPFGRWVVPSYRKIPPPSQGGFDWDFVPLPRGKTEANIVLTVSWSISAQTAHPEESWRLVRFLSGEQTQRDLAKLGLAIPTIRAAAESSAFLDPSLPPANDAGYLRAAEVAQIVDWPVNPQFEALMGSRLDQGLKTADVPLPEAIANFERDWNAECASPLRGASLAPMPWDAIGLAAILLFVLVAGVWMVRLRSGSLTGREREDERAGYALASPWIVGFLLFMAFPVAMSLLLAFARWKGVSPLAQADFAGTANFEQIFTSDARFRTSMRVTLWYALIAVPTGQILALLAALLMNTKVRGIHLFRAAWYLPSVLAGVGVSVLWRWVFDSDHGLMNMALEPLLKPLGIVPPEWFGADAGVWGAPAFAIMSLWFVGGTMMVYLAGLQQVPADLLEAAAIDGAGPLRRFFSVTLPMLSPVILFNTIMAVISSFQVFTQSFVMTGGEPGDLTRFLVLYIFNQGFEFYEMGYASALAWILLVIVLVLTAIVLRTSNRWVHVEGGAK